MQRKTKSIDKSLAYLFMQSGNPDMKVTFIPEPLKFFIGVTKN